MKFDTFFITLLGLVLIGISIGYVIGYFIRENSFGNNWIYLSVLFMGIGCFMSIYGSLFSNKK